MVEHGEIRLWGEVLRQPQASELLRRRAGITRGAARALGGTTRAAGALSSRGIGRSSTRVELRKGTCSRDFAERRSTTEPSAYRLWLMFLASSRRACTDTRRPTT